MPVVESIVTAYNSGASGKIFATDGAGQWLLDRGRLIPTAKTLTTLESDNTVEIDSLEIILERYDGALLSQERKEELAALKNF